MKFRTAICGPRYAHQAERQASRAGTVPSEVVLGGRKVAIRRQNARATRSDVDAIDDKPDQVETVERLRLPRQAVFAATLAGCPAAPL